MAINKENLEGNGFDEITAERQREIASMGGKASAEARKRRKDLRLAMEMLLEKNTKIKDLDGKEKTVSGAEAIAVAQYKKALKGDTKAFEVVRDTSGQAVVQKVAFAEVDADILREVEDMVLNETE